MLIIKYKPVFSPRCIEIFKNNSPKFFAPEELQLFEDFLDHHTEDNYYVVRYEEQIVACGGIFAAHRHIYIKKMDLTRWILYLTALVRK